MRHLVAKTLSQVEMRPVKWTWRGWVPSRNVSLLSGEGGLGKSTLLAYLAAHMTTGTLPGDLFGKPSDVLWLSYEDTPEEVLKPRLTAAGVDPERVHIVTAQEDEFEDGVNLQADTEQLGFLARQHSARLLVVDPILSAMGSGVDSHKAAEVRRALAPLQQLAESHDLAALCVLHFKKGEEPNPLSRVEASGAFTQLARSTLVFGINPDEEGGREGSNRVLVHAKSNLSRLHAAEAFTIETVWLGDDREIETTRLVSNGESSATAEDLSRPTSKDERSDHEQAAEFILDALADGAMKAADLQAAAVADGHSERTFRRARESLKKAEKVKREKDGQGPWIWSLGKVAIDQDPPEEDRGHLGQVGLLGHLPHDATPNSALANNWGGIG